MAMKNNELVIWNEVHPNYTIFHNETETFSSLWSHYDGNIHHFQNVYSEDMARYGDNLILAKGRVAGEHIFRLGHSLVTFTSFNITVADMKNFFADVYAGEILRTRRKSIAACRPSDSPFRVRWFPYGTTVQ
jgi:chloramphenicol O-acetyltransferase type A